MPETVASLTLLEQLRAKRTEELNGIAALVEKRAGERDAFEKRERSEDAKPTDEERSAFTVAEEDFGKDFDRREADVKVLNQRIREQEAVEERRQDAANAAKGTSMSVTSEPLTYRKDNQREVSYFRDLAARSHSTFASKHDDLEGAHERLERHSKEIEVELPKRELARERRAEERIDQAELEFSGSLAGVRQRRGFEVSPFERRVNPNRTDGQGGYLVPPIWLMDDFIPGLRAGRPTADLCRNLDVPPGTDSINIPKLSTKTLTGVQTADAAGVTSQDFTDTSVSASVLTIAGQEDVSLQLLEQSPGGLVDQVITEDLMADYNLQIDTQVLRGTGASGQCTGLLPVSNYSGANTVTWTSTTLLGSVFSQALGAAASKTSYNRYNLDNLHFVMHPRRWFWYATSLDASDGKSGRPVVGSDQFGPFNSAALQANPTPYQGLAGRTPFGVPVHIDGNVPIVAASTGAVTGGSSDLALAGKFDDFWLFEGSPRTRVLPEILSGTLQVRFQLWNYFSFLVRYGQSISVILGTGMAAPTSLQDTSITF